MSPKKVVRAAMNSVAFAPRAIQAKIEIFWKPPFWAVGWGSCYVATGVGSEGVRAGAHPLSKVGSHATETEAVAVEFPVSLI